MSENSTLNRVLLRILMYYSAGTQQFNCLQSKHGIKPQIRYQVFKAKQVEKT